MFHQKKTVHFRDDAITREIYLENGVLHREDGPARTWFHDNDVPKVEEYYCHGVRHREDGPAIIHYDEHGEITREIFIVNGEEQEEEL